MFLPFCMPLVATSLVIALSFSGPAFAEEETHTKDKLEDVMAAVKAKKAVLIDVREKSEWDKGHLKGAKLVPLSALKNGLKSESGDAEGEKLRDIIPPDRIVYIHCASGYRCLDAAPLLRKHGYEVRALAAGYKQLVKAGFPQAPAEKIETAVGVGE